MLTRRQMLQAAAATAAATTVPRRARAAPPPYRDAVVIDAMGGPGDVIVKEPWSRLSAAAVADARASGMTACHVTVAAGYDSWEDTVRSLGWWEREIADHADVFLRVTRAADLRDARAQKKMGIFFGLQGLAMLGDDLNRLETLAGLGLRVAQLTYNVRALTGDGCLEPGDAGLSRFGRATIERIEGLRLALDLSHGGRRTTAEAIAAARRPFITHTGCAAIHDHPRNVPDEALRAVADKGGVIGIYFMPYLRPSGQPMAEDVLRHLEHALEVAGEDHVGVGTDGVVSALVVTDELRRQHREEVARRRKLGVGAPGETEDVFNYIPDLNGPRRLEALSTLLGKRGLGERQIGKVLGGNFARAFGEVWG